MKTVVLLSFVFMAGCIPVRKMNAPDALAPNPKVQLPIPELTASADTLPPDANAAQMSGGQEADFGQEKPKLAAQTIRRRPDGQRIAARKPPVIPSDSTASATSRKPADTRKTNKLGLVSSFLAAGSLTMFIISSNGEGRESTNSALVAIAIGIAAFVTGLVSLSEFRRNPGKFKGRGYAKAGRTWGLTVLICAVVIGLLTLAAMLLFGI